MRKSKTCFPPLHFHDCIAYAFLAQIQISVNNSENLNSRLIPFLSLKKKRERERERAREREKPKLLSLFNFINPTFNSSRFHQFPTCSQFIRSFFHQSQNAARVTHSRVQRIMCYGFAAIVKHAREIVRGVKESKCGHSSRPTKPLFLKVDCTFFGAANAWFWKSAQAEPWWPTLFLLLTLEKYETRAV